MQFQFGTMLEDQCVQEDRQLGKDCMCQGPPGLGIDIAAVTENKVCGPCGPSLADCTPESSDSDWSSMSSSSQKAKKSASSGEEMMVQALTDQSFTKVCVDSGAGESVCPIDAFPSYGTHKTTKTGARYTAAGGQELVNAGEKRPHFKCGGKDAFMAFQCTQVQKPLAAASKIAEKGNRIVLDDANSESYILHKASETKIPLTIENGVYMMEMRVKPAAAPFQGQAKA